MRFAYREYDAAASPADRSDVVWRPAFKVSVCAVDETRARPLWGILDSGAVECVLPRDAADDIKPIWAEGEWFLIGYAGPPRPVQYGAVKLTIALGREMIRWTAVVALSLDRDEAIWGQAHFLEHFSVTFNGPDRHFTIRRRAKHRPSFDVSRLPRPFRPLDDRSEVIPWEDQDPSGASGP